MHTPIYPKGIQNPIFYKQTLKTPHTPWSYHDQKSSPCLSCSHGCSDPTWLPWTLVQTTHHSLQRIISIILLLCTGQLLYVSDFMFVNMCPYVCVCFFSIALSSHWNYCRKNKITLFANFISTKQLLFQLHTHDWIVIIIFQSLTFRCQPKKATLING